jgi:hypothetical protein
MCECKKDDCLTHIGGPCEVVLSSLLPARWVNKKGEIKIMWLCKDCIRRVPAKDVCI